MPELVSPTRSHGLVEILDRVLDKGLVIAGDIKINLANVELLTIQVRLLVCSIDKAEQIGMNWWRTDPRLSAPAFDPAVGARSGTSIPIGTPPEDLAGRLERIERLLERLAERAGPPSEQP